METKTIFILFLFSLCLISCEQIDYKTLKINHKQSKIEILDAKKFIIDSIFISKGGKKYFSLGLKNRNQGSQDIRLDKIDESKYNVYFNKLDELYKTEEIKGDSLISGNLVVYIREKGIEYDIVNSSDYNKIQNFSYKYIPIKGKIITYLNAERKYK